LWVIVWPKKIQGGGIGPVKPDLVMSLFEGSIEILATMWLMCYL